MNLIRVIRHLFPGAKPHHDFIVINDQIVRWSLAEPQPTQAELDAAWAVIQNGGETPLWSELRREHYPTIEAQLAMLWKHIANQNQNNLNLEVKAMSDLILAINAKYQPPTS